jgi:hypothetical protein
VTIRRSIIPAAVAVALCASTVAGAAPGTTRAGTGIAGTIELVSVGPGGVQADHDSDEPSVSADGRYVAFTSSATNLDGGAPGQTDVFLHDRDSGTTTLVSVDGAGEAANGASSRPSLSADGRLVAFQSTASDLVDGDSNGVADVFLRDLDTGETTLVSLDGSDGPADGASSDPDLSADGGHVAFVSRASDLVAGDDNGQQDVFVRDLDAGDTVMASINHLGEPSDFSTASLPRLSDDGRYVAFSSLAGDLDPPDSNILVDAFVRDLDSGVTTLVSKDRDGGPANSSSYAVAISGDGNLVLFDSPASDLVEQPVGHMQVYLRDVAAGLTERVSLDTDGEPGDERTRGTALSGDGRYVLMSTETTNLPLCGGSAGDDLILRDLVTGRNTTVAIGLDHRPEATYAGDLASSGATAAFTSRSSGLVAGHSGTVSDVFAVDLSVPFGPLFTDVLDTHPFRCDIGWLVDEGIGQGYDDDTFRPASPVSRQAMAAFLHRHAGSPPVTLPTTPTFPDVPANHPFYDEIEWLAATGITTGNPDGTFRPAAQVSRQAMAAYLHRYAGEPEVDLPTTPTFPDVPLTHPFFEEIEWLQAEGIAGGFDDETFRPATAVSRQSMSAFLHRYDENL